MTALALALLLQSAPPPAAPRERADETFRLDIDSRRITGGPYRAGTAVELVPDGGGLALRIGALLTAARIDVHLRNVRGTVRFRADLGPVQAALRRGGRRPVESRR